MLPHPESPRIAVDFSAIVSGSKARIVPARSFLNCLPLTEWYGWWICGRFHVRDEIPGSQLTNYRRRLGDSDTLGLIRAGYRGVD